MYRLSGKRDILLFHLRANQVRGVNTSLVYRRDYRQSPVYSGGFIPNGAPYPEKSHKPEQHNNNGNGTVKPGYGAVNPLTAL